MNTLTSLAIWFIISFPLGVLAGRFLQVSDERAESELAAMLSEQAARKLGFVELVQAQQVERLNRSTGELTLISIDEALGEPGRTERLPSGTAGASHPARHPPYGGGLLRAPYRAQLR